MPRFLEKIYTLLTAINKTVRLYKHCIYYKPMCFKLLQTAWETDSRIQIHRYSNLIFEFNLNYISRQAFTLTLIYMINFQGYLALIKRI